MRVLVVNKFFWNKGGSERVMFDLSEGYSRAGHEVAHFAMRSEQNRASPWSAHFAPAVSWDGGPLAQLRTAGRVIYSREAARRILGLIRAFRPDVCHLHNFHHQLSPSIVDALRAAGVPCVHTLHDYKLICPSYVLYTEGALCERCRGGRFHHAVLHRCVRGARGPSLVAALEMAVHRSRRTVERGVAMLVSPSRFLRDKLVEFGTDPGRVRVVPNGVDVPPEQADGRARGFLFAGRLSEEKGLRTLLAAMSLVPEASLTICGTGPLRAELVHLAERMAPGRVSFPGHLDPDALSRRMRESRALVMPSEWYENAPLAALEALAAGVPVCASRIGGIPEIVRDGQNGLLFTAGRTEELAACLRQLDREEDLAVRLGREGARLVRQEFSLGDQVRRMLSLLEEVSASASR